MTGRQLLSLLLIGILNISNALDQYISAAFDNYHLECAKSSGKRKSGAKIFWLTCLFPWDDIPETVAELEREDCYYSNLIDPLIDENTLASCGKREYIAGITRLSTTRIQFLCCRLRTKDETSCIEKNYQKPSDTKPVIDIAQNGLVLNALSINQNKYTARFCTLKARDIDTLIKDVGTTRNTKKYTTSSTATASTFTFTRATVSTFTSTIMPSTTTSTAASTTTSTAASTKSSTINSTTVSTTTTTKTSTNPPTTVLSVKANITSANANHLPPTHQLFRLSNSSATKTGGNYVDASEPITFQPIPIDLHNKSILTFCTKDIAVRDMNNLIIACGDNFEIWRPKRCPEKSDCFFAKDSTYRICCPVADASSSTVIHSNRFS
uniref:Thyroglobulin type-1 domain-containing protein n=1 Tax=Syphacia muris TaxID=451379 RepID=A0A158R514_9BILA